MNHTEQKNTADNTHLASQKLEILPLTSLRFLVALYVFLFHVHIRWPIVSHEFIANILSQGAVGMSFFFVLSGYILAYQYYKTDINNQNYFTNRVARIYPVYVLAAIITLPWLGIDLKTADSSLSFQALSQLIVLIVTNIFLIQAWFPQTFNYWNDGGSWSISVEAFFYILFPFLIKNVSNKSSKFLWTFIIAVYFLGILPGIIISLFGLKSEQNYYYSIPLFRLPEFILGVCTYIVGHDMKIRKANVLLLISLLSFGLYLGFVGDYFPYYIGHNWFILPLTAFIILLLSKVTGWFGKIFYHKTLVWAGKISYCFYSFQALVILFLINNHESVRALVPILKNKYVFTFTVFLILTVISAIAYHGIEEPMRDWIKGRFRLRKDVSKPLTEPLPSF